MSTLAPDEFSHSQVDAMSAWLDLGTSSLTNPVLAFALQTFGVPLGIECEWLEFDVIYSSGPTYKPRLHRPSFKPKRKQIEELAGEFQRVFAPLADYPDRYAATLGIFGDLQISLHPPVRKPDEADRQLAFAAENAPTMVREALNMAHRYLQSVGSVLVSEDADAEQIRQKLIDKDCAGFAEGALRFSAK
jgi:hypothetical protein